METDSADPTVAAAPEPTAAPAAMTVPEPESPPESPPLTFERVKEMVEKGIELVEKGILPGTTPFHQQDGLDWHGFKAWRAAHADETGTAAGELDTVEAKAVVDATVETAEAKAAREAQERAKETPQARIARVAWEEEIDGDGNKIHAPTHFAKVGTTAASTEAAPVEVEPAAEVAQAPALHPDAQPPTMTDQPV